MKLAALLMLLVAGIAAPAGALGASSERDAAGGIPQAHAVRGCAGAGPYWPTMTLALQGRNAWVACKEQSRLVRLRLPGGRKTATVNFGGPVTAVAVGYGSVWALDGSTLYRLDRGSGRITRRIQLGARAPYNIWLGAGSVWVADDQGAAVVRVSLSTNKVVARIAVGDGPADMAFRGMQGWVVTHRDNTVYSVDTATNRATRLATVGGSDAAAERIALLGDALWITGRGVGLIELDPASGAVRRTVDIDGTGIDVVAAAGALWVAVRSMAVDRSGFPTMTAVRRVAPDGTVKTVATAQGHVDVHGLAAGLGSVWIADNTSGLLHRLPT
jgi:DNA-binding beta-propeller fold protein YncE